MTRQSLLIDTQLIYIYGIVYRTETGDDIDRVILILLLLLLVNVYIMTVIVIVTFTFECETWGVLFTPEEKKTDKFGQSRLVYR